MKPYFPGAEAAARAAVHDRPEVPAGRRQGHRSRRGRAHRAPRVDVRDARQLLVRRLLQGRRGRPRLGVRDRALAVRPRSAVGERVRRRPEPRDRRGRGGGGRPGCARASRASGSSPFPRSENFWGPAGETGPVRPLLGAPLRPRRRARLRRARLRARTASAATATSSSGTSSSWSSTSPPTARLTPLPKQNIDTGMGLERGAMLVQEADSIFDTDGFRLIMDWIERESGVHYGASQEATKAHRVLSDHGRGMTFLVAEGITPVERGARLRPPPADPALGRPGQANRPAGRPPAPASRRRAGRALVPGGRRERRRRSSAWCAPRRSGSARRSTAACGSSRSCRRATSAPRTRSGSPRPTASRSS